VCYTATIAVVLQPLLISASAFLRSFAIICKVLGARCVMSGALVLCDQCGDALTASCPAMDC